MPSSDTKHPYTSRHLHIRHLLKQEQLQAILVSNRSSIVYLTGLMQQHPNNREAILIITPDTIKLHHSLFISPPKKRWLDSSTLSKTNTISKFLLDSLADATRIGIESTDLRVSEYHQFQAILDHATFIPIETQLTSLRSHKSSSEIAAIKQANQITLKAIAFAEHFLQDQPKISEIQLTHTINQFMLDQGAQEIAFPTIVAFDEHTSSPHHIPTTKTCHKDSIVLVDCGAKYRGYCSDATRTFSLNNPPAEFITIKKVVDQAYSRVIKKINRAATNTDNLTAHQVDATARNHINKAGYGKYFIHSTGHGIGLDIHEVPSISPSQDTQIQTNMAFTIEPGIYIPGRFGYRYENTITLTT